MMLTTEQNDLLIQKDGRVLILRDFSGIIRIGVVANFNGIYRIGTWMEGFDLQMFLADGWISIPLDSDVEISSNPIKLPIIPELME